MLESKIKELTAAVEALTQAINDSQALVTQPTTPSEPVSAHEATDPEPPLEPTPDPEPEPAPTLSDADLNGLLLTMSREGHKTIIRDKLTGFGAGRVSELNAADREMFVDWLIELGEKA